MQAELYAIRCVKIYDPSSAAARASAIRGHTDLSQSSRGKDASHFTGKPDKFEWQEAESKDATRVLGSSMLR
eukprot:6204298-Pleurochrysis_carterae.AAC.8